MYYHIGLRIYIVQLFNVIQTIEACAHAITFNAPMHYASFADPYPALVIKEPGRLESECEVAFPRSTIRSSIPSSVWNGHHGILFQSVRQT